jgi:Anti-sigma-K factor rskA, C-terminal
MSADRFLELAALDALGVLDGDDLADFRAHLPTCPECQAELRSHEGVAARLGLAAGVVPPPRGLKARVLGAAGIATAPLPLAPPRPAPRRAWWPALAAAAAVVLALAGGYLAGSRGRDQARAEVARLQGEREDLLIQFRAAQAEALSLRIRLTQEAAFHDLLAHGDTRTTRLAALAPAPGAQARVVWNTAARQTVFLATGLQPPPPGKAYELWVIAGQKPVPAGVFKADERGRAVVTLPWADETIRVQTFAVTVEPEAGSPAPTSPLVLAGAVS